jgi:hypothetical protein
MTQTYYCREDGVEALKLDLSTEDGWEKYLAQAEENYADSPLRAAENTAKWAMLDYSETRYDRKISVVDERRNKHLFRVQLTYQIKSTVEEIVDKRR